MRVMQSYPFGQQMSSQILLIDVMKTKKILLNEFMGELIAKQRRSDVAPVFCESRHVFRGVAHRRLLLIIFIKKHNHLPPSSTTFFLVTWHTPLLSTIYLYCLLSLTYRFRGLFICCTYRNFIYFCRIILLCNLGLSCSRT